MEVVETCPVTALLAGGGVYYDVTGTNAVEVLTSLFDRIALPQGVDPDGILEQVLQRECLAPTAIGDGIAIPHPENCAALHLPSTTLALAMLASPVNFHAPDGKPVHSVFLLLSRDQNEHSRVLVHLSRMLTKSLLPDALARRTPKDELLELFRRAEEAIHTLRAPRPVALI